MSKVETSVRSSEPVENYLKTIFQLSSEGVGASTQDIASRVGVSGPGVSKMLRQLSQHHLIDYTPYQPVHLTALGRKMALEVIRHHRLLELYLTESLGYGWDVVHAEAERLEHYISEEFEDRIERLLGYPSHDPHGDPIPTREGTMPEPVRTTLEQQAPGSTVIVRRVTDEDDALLRYLGERGLRPGVVLEVVEREPFGGSLHLRRGDRIERLSPEAARQVFVESCVVTAPETAPIQRSDTPNEEGS